MCVYVGSIIIKGLLSSIERDLHLAPQSLGQVYWASYLGLDGFDPICA
jgi:hypothetical protein